MLSSPAKASDGPRSYIHDPITVLAFFGAVITALVLVVFIWTNRANSLGPWRAEHTAIWALLCFAPILVLSWSAIPSSDIAVSSYVTMRRIIQVHAIIAACITVIGCSGMGAAGYFFVRLNDLLGVLAFGALVIDLIVLGVAPWSKSDPDDIKPYRTMQLKIAGGAVAAIVVWSFLNIGMVVAQAELIAWGRPYCLLVAGDYLGGYKQVRSLIELNSLKMHTPFTSGGGTGYFQFAYHAVLGVDREGGFEWRHWSYTTQNFIRHDNGKGIADRGGPLFCKPYAHFAFQLSGL